MRHDIAEFLAVCEAWCGETGVKLSTLSTRMLGRGAALDRAKAGKQQFSPKTMRKAYAWLHENPAETYRANHMPGRPPREPQSTT